MCVIISVGWILLCWNDTYRLIKIYMMWNKLLRWIYRIYKDLFVSPTTTTLMESKNRKGILVNEKRKTLICSLEWMMSIQQNLYKQLWFYSDLSIALLKPDSMLKNILECLCVSAHTQTHAHAHAYTQIHTRKHQYPWRQIAFGVLKSAIKLFQCILYSTWQVIEDINKSLIFTHVISNCKPLSDRWLCLNKERQAGLNQG